MHPRVLTEEWRHEIEWIAALPRLLDALAERGLDRERCRDWGFAHALAWGRDERSGWSAEAIERARTSLAA